MEYYSTSRKRGLVPFATPRTTLSDVTLRGLSPEDQDRAASYVKSEKAELAEAEEGGGGPGAGGRGQGEAGQGAHVQLWVSSGGPTSGTGTAGTGTALRT